ncbi:hypothetical protein E1202_13635 [Saccharopolyspora karakumensis]|uniref:Uncharacterized protein n=1 Tax=Saccharopolyspora karakumensis TaxID=2530386 RepID=A0A4R5BP04_9PSEU|nr:hypothetical protein [Saccharopolyspora karakumensis]TDD88611.1 hypothetical protein E1202_13635 [Saccharopolyspora karakumensis]
MARDVPRPSRRSRMRPRAVPAVRLLLATALIAPNAASAQDSVYTLTVDPNATGPIVDDTMYGIFYEDINRAADGGLYAELVQNRAFEYDPADNTDHVPLTST